MKTSAGKIVLVILLLPLAAAPQASAPSTASPRATGPTTSPQTAAPAVAPRPVPSPTPAPPKTNPGLATAAIADAAPTTGYPASLGTLPLSALTKKTAPKVRNPHLMIAHGTILSIIAEQESAAKSIRASRGLQVPASKPMSAPGNSTGQVSNAPGPAAASIAKPTPTPNPMGQASMAEVVPCVATTKIRLVDGKTKGVVFTPIIPGNNGSYQVPQHVIQGCYFGKQQGSAYLFGNFKKGQLQLNINYWSDSEIDVALDPNLEGEMDEDNVTLVIKLADGTQLKAPGFKFYAARGEPIPLQVIPSYALQAKYGGTPPTTFVSPQSVNVPGAYLAREKSQFIPRTASNRCADPINSSTLLKGHDSGVDYYDFSKLRQGFTTDSYSWVYWYNGANDCRALQKVDTRNYCEKGPSVTPGDNLLEVQWDGDNIKVGWRTQFCAWSGWELQNGTWNGVFDVYSMSRYALTVYVVGPKGVTPWADGKQ